MHPSGAEPDFKRDSGDRQMANFRGSGGLDSFSGAAGENNTFSFRREYLSGDDIVTGSTLSSDIDHLNFTTGGAVTAEMLQGVSAIEQVRFSHAGNTIELTSALVGSANRPLVVKGRDGEDTVDTTALDPGQAVTIAFGGNDDRLVGGAGAEKVLASFTTLGASDTLLFDAGLDTLRMTDNGTLSAAALAGITGLDQVQMRQGGTLAFADGMFGPSGALLGSGAADSFDASAVTDAAFTFRTGAGADTLIGGAGDDVLDVGSADFARVDGGGGFDRLILRTGASVDLRGRTDNEIAGIEAVRFNPDGAGELTLDPAAIARLTGGGNRLFVVGGTDDTLHAGGGWEPVACAVTDPEFPDKTFAHYRQDGVDLFVQDGIGTNAINLADVAQGQGGFKITGEAGYDRAGVSVSAAGDVNNDGYDDLLVGADGNNGTGAAYLLFGDATPPDAVSLADVALGQGGFKITGEAGDGAGYSVSAAGDVNNDGYDDLLVGAYGNKGFTGAAYLLFGDATPPDAAVSLADVAQGQGGFKITGEAGGDYAGVSVSAAGDVNNDGYDDLLVGADGNNGTGAAYLLFGDATPPDAVSLADVALGQGGFKITGEAGGDGAGVSVSAAGDVNNDGYDDLLVGAYGNKGFTGAAYLLFGDATPPDAVSLADVALGQGGFKITGEANYDYAGISVSAAGDVNNDGYDDLLVGAYGNKGFTGAAYLLFGDATPPDAAVSLADVAQGQGGFKITGEAGGDGAGVSVSAAGDVNNDGYDDLLVGAYGNNGGTGAAYVIYGDACNSSDTLLF